MTDLDDTEGIDVSDYHSSVSAIRSTPADGQVALNVNTWEVWYDPQNFVGTSTFTIVGAPINPVWSENIAFTITVNQAIENTGTTTTTTVPARKSADNKVDDFAI